MKKIYIISACRTPIGKMGGILSLLSATDLGTIVVNEVISRAKINKTEIDHLCMGCVLQAGLGQNIARQIAINSNLPITSTAETVNIVCGSGLKAINSSARMIQTGDADIVIAGGCESMSNAPYLLNKARFGYRMGNSQLIDSMVNDGLWDAVNNYHMGITAENICNKYNLSREELDAFSLQSQNKACKAISEGKFKNEIVPVSVKQKKQTVLYDTDEAPRFDISIEGLSKLKPAFKENGLVTAGNSSGINDGAAVVLLASEEKVNELNLNPIAEWIDGAIGGVDPALMGLGPIESTKKLLNKNKISINNIDLIEANEAFASQAIAVAKELHFDNSILNVNGGAIALGHPIGASGCRILVTLIYEMQKRKSKLGLATLCIGGGMGCSALVRGV